MDLRHSLKSFDPDIVHTTGMYTGLLTLLARSLQKKKFKVIMTLHHTSSTFRYNFIAKRLVRFLNRVDMVHYLSEYQKNLYINFGLNPRKFKVIPNISYARSYSEEEVKVLKSKLLDNISADWLLVYVGRLVESKQLNVFIETIKKINNKGFNVGGVIVGSGEESYVNNLVNLATEKDIISKIIFTGFSKQPELYIKASDFCLFPTLHDEALPLFILESFSQQRTMIVSNHPSISNIVDDYIDSLVSDNHTSEAYAEKCIELIDNKELLKKLEEGALFKFNSFYKAEIVIKEFKKMYMEIMKK